MKYLIMFGPAAVIIACAVVGWTLHFRRLARERRSDGIMHDGETE